MLPLLNSQQLAAVCYLDGPCLVLAGAGSGKTRVITEKIAYLVKTRQYDAQHIAAITFTNKAAQEMGSRIKTLLPPNPGKGPTISTFHSLGLKILREEATHLGYKLKFSVLDSADCWKIVADSLSTTDKVMIRLAVSQISLLKNRRISPDQALLCATSEGELQLARLYRSYQDTLFAYQAMDFDDLIRLPTDLFELEPILLSKWRSRLRYLLIDEYQDTNSTQYLLVKQLAGDAGMLTAVGDDDQSIYAWRGASTENMALLQADFPQLRVIKLEQNYRSVARILKCANAVIAHNPKLFEKRLWSDLGIGDWVQVVECKNEEHEAELVTMKLIAHQFDAQTRYGDYAILYRSNHQARMIEQRLRESQIPYTLSGGQSFFDKAEIKDVLAYLRLIANEEDDPAFIRAVTTPKRGVGNTTLEKLGAWAAQNGISLFAAACEDGFHAQIQAAQSAPLMQFCQFMNHMQARAAREAAGPLLQEILSTINFEVWLHENNEPGPAQTRWKHVQDLVSWISRKGEEGGKNLIELSQTIALMTLLEGRDEEEVDAVKLSTLHASKGLEYPHVFLIGCEEETLPHRESMEGVRIEEERRLMYVGITRARRSLTITYCNQRRRGGEWHTCTPSRFLKELPPEEIRVSGRLAGNKSVPIVTKQEGRAVLAGLITKLR